jgi:hypothetical protein
MNSAGDAPDQQDVSTFGVVVLSAMLNTGQIMISAPLSGEVS